MTELWIIEQPIIVTLDANGIPTDFTWLDMKFFVTEIVDERDVDSYEWRAEGSIQQNQWAVITTSNMFCTIGLDTLRGWLLIRTYV